MTVTEQHPVDYDDLPDDPFLEAQVPEAEVAQFVEPGQVEKVTLEEARVLWNAISNRSFSEYRVLRKNSRGAITKRTNFARAFAALELENPAIIRGEE